MLTFLLADNQPVTSLGIRSLIRDEFPDGAFPVAANRTELIQKLKIHPDAVVILDYTVFDFSAVHQLLNLQAGFPESRWILFSEELGEPFLRHILIQSPETGVILKTCTLDEIRQAIHCAVESKTFLCETIRNLMHKNTVTGGSSGKLTPAEREILHEIALGKTTKEIASERNLSFHTVNAHRRNIFRKLEVNNVHEAIRYAVRAGIIDMTEYYI